MPGKGCCGGVAQVGMDERITGWWDAVLAGETDEPHPIHGERVKVRLKRDSLELTGILDHAKDRDQLVRQARSRIGKGIRKVDVERLVVAPRLERPGVLEQTIIAAYSDRATAELARNFVVEHSRVTPKHEAIVDHTNSKQLANLVPDEYVDDIRKRIDRGEAVLVIRVDETAAFTVRGLLEEETRCHWTMATPPEVAARV
ncbi:MAG TPA: hypothetical protein VFK22_07320 [Candidatus Dormibacteraeota bacterium]|nr:hypothetical protein [Candidatus Dormibacteraeota bacterium]